MTRIEWWGVCAATIMDDDMITSIHMLIYSDDANATRAFLRDVLGLKYVAEDFDKDWLIFKSGKPLSY